MLLFVITASRRGRGRGRRRRCGRRRRARRAVHERTTGMYIAIPITASITIAIPIAIGTALRQREFERIERTVGGEFRGGLVRGGQLWGARERVDDQMGRWAVNANRV